MTDESKYTQYTAVANGGFLHICTVIAEDEADARTQLDDQLTRNPSRTPYHTQWVAEGRMLLNTRTNEVTVA
jgi:hypothetical protein